MTPEKPANEQTGLSNVVASTGAETRSQAASATDKEADPTVSFELPHPLKPASGGFIPSIDGFEIEGRLGRGGMGIVYRARDLRLGRLVAIKVLRWGADATDQELDRFQQEARVIAQLRHPHVVQVHEVGEAGGLVYLVLEFMNGGALSDYLDARALPPRLSAEIVATLCQGAAAAHRVGVVHRDLKPGNVLVSLPAPLASEQERRDAAMLEAPGVVLKLADFGLAKASGADDIQTTTGVMVGTPRYAAPEQVEGKSAAVSPATDVYSLGAILYELTTGAAVFRAPTVLTLLDMIRKAEPISPRVLQPSLDRDMETICLKCLRKNPQERYDSAEALGDDLRRWLKREPILARPVGTVERTVKWARRNPLATALSGVGMLAALAIGALIVSIVYQAQLSSTNDELVQARQSLHDKNNQLSQQNAELDRARITAQSAEAETARQRDLLARHRYAADMQSAGAAWRSGDIARVMALLARNVPPPDAPAAADLRGWEWRYLKGLLTSDRGRIPALFAAYSPAGDLLAVARDGKIELLDPKTRAPIRELEDVQTNVLRFAFSADGKRLLGGCQNAPHFRVWNVADGKRVAKFERQKATGHLALSPDGSLALTAENSFDFRTVKLWRVDTREVLLDWLAVDATGITYSGPVAFSGDGKWFAISWPLKKSVRIGKTAAPAEVVEVPVPDADAPLRFDHESKRLFVSREDQVGWISLENLTSQSQFVPTTMRRAILDLEVGGRLMATGVSTDKSLRIWDVSSGRQLNERRGPVGGHNSFSFRAATKQGVVTGNDQSLRFCGVFDSQDYSLLPVNLYYPSVIEFSPDGHSLAVAGHNSKIALLDAHGPKTLEAPLPNVWQAAFSPDGQLLAAASWDGICRWWNVADGKVVHDIVGPKGQPFFCVAFDNKGQRLAIGSSKGHVPIWDVPRKKELPERGPGQGDVFLLRFRPGSDELVTYSGGTLMFGGHQTLRAWKSGATNDFLFTRDGSGIYLPSSDVKLCDAETFEVRTTFSGHQSHIVRLALNTDEARLATASSDGTVKLWDVKSGQETFSIQVPYPVRVAFSPDGRKLVIGSHLGEFRVFEASAGYLTSE